ncbi:unnamed protein product [Ceratitis capitata]|uniref:(Mediterranean fruit fly) hypothetical protein n=1 Tax=Ceratitis capitata TaxID=7213 RepID=A0A811U4M4_CERCA|nr:unnamed protein product [Ceratitis capitata]
MRSNFRNGDWWRCLSGIPGTLLIFLLILHPTCIHTTSGKVEESKHQFLKFTKKNFDNTTTTKALSEGGTMVHSFRFHDFEPRSISEYTWTAASTRTKMSPKVDLEAKAINGEESESVLSENEKRNARGIHFEADGRDLSINLEFIVPFLRIPIARSVAFTQTAFRKLTDLNSGTLLLSSGFAILGALIASVVKTAILPSFYGYGYKKTSRATGFLDDLNIGSNAPIFKEGLNVFENLEKSLLANNINITSCAQRVICSYVHRATTDVRAGLGTPSDRIIDGLVGLESLKVYLNGTALRDAIESGLMQDTSQCEQTYRNCEWPKIQNKAWKLAVDLMSHYIGRLH